MASNDTPCVAPLHTELPAEIVSHILSFIGVNDKLNATCAIPQWEDALTYPATWNTVCFEFKNSGFQDELEFMLECLSNYGRYFPSLRLVYRNSSHLENQLKIMQDVCENCSSLRVLEIKHPLGWGPLYKDKLVVYASTLKTICIRNKGLKSVAVGFEHYKSMDKSQGVEELLQEILCPESDVCQSLHKISFSHNYPLLKPVHSLVPCTNLLKLGCPIHNLDTRILEQLLQNTKVGDLHIVNNEHTIETGFHEHVYINWASLFQTFSRRRLRVHYHVQNRPWGVMNFVVNPFIHTLVFDCQHSDGMLVTLANCVIFYHTSLQVLMLLSNNDEPPYADIEDDLSHMPGLCCDVVHNCTLLHTFISSIPLPAAAILTIAANKKVRNIYALEDSLVYDHVDNPNASLWQVEEDIRVDWWRKIVNDRTSLVKIVSKFVGYEWKPSTQEQLQGKISELLEVF